MDATVSSTRSAKPRRSWWAFWFLAPASALFLAFVVLPIVLAAILSFFDWNGIGPLSFAGLANWRGFLGDSAAIAALRRTFILVAGCLLLQEPLALVLGVFGAGRQRYRAVLTAVYFLPLLISGAAIGVLWTNLLSPVGGGVQYAADHWGLFFLGQNWLGDPKLAFATVIVLISWEFVPYHTLIYQAGARQIPPAVYEAAALDGVGPWQRFRYITLPLLRNTMVTSSTLNVLGSFTVFDLIFTLTGGGPGESSRVLALQQYYVGFTQLQFGYASVLAVILGAIGMLFSLVVIRISNMARMASVTEGGA
jgi:raffinose/stachyose/melibiose transport system permease protein